MVDNNTKVVLTMTVTYELAGPDGLSLAFIMEQIQELVDKARELGEAEAHVKVPNRELSL